MKQILIVLLVLSVMVAGCQQAVFEKVRLVAGEKTQLEFSVPSHVSSYKIQTTLRYSYGYGKGLDKATVKLVSPSGKVYENFALLSAKKATQSGTRSEIVSFSNVLAEEGNFTLFVENDGRNTDLRKVTLRVYNNEEQ